MNSWKQTIKPKQKPNKQKTNLSKGTLKMGNTLKGKWIDREVDVEFKDQITFRAYFPVLKVVSSIVF